MAVLFAWIRGVLTRFSGTGKKRPASEGVKAPKAALAYTRACSGVC